MTNSRLTDPEILETRFPVVLEDFHIRHGSGGKGRWHAGDGTSRTIRFREAMDCAILSGHRKVRAVRPRGRRARRDRPQHRAAARGATEELPAPTRPRWRRARPSPSSRRPAAALAAEKA